MPTAGRSAGDAVLSQFSVMRVSTPDLRPSQASRSAFQRGLRPARNARSSRSNSARTASNWRATSSASETPSVGERLRWFVGIRQRMVRIRWRKS